MDDDMKGIVHATIDRLAKENEKLQAANARLRELLEAVPIEFHENGKPYLRCVQGIPWAQAIAAELDLGRQEESNG